MTVIGHGYDDNVGAPAFRNVIINGSMSVAQRSLGPITGITSVSPEYPTADRWRHFLSSMGTWTNSIENDAPTGSGFRKSWKWLCTTADASPSSTDFFPVGMKFEGQNLQHFAKGTSSAKSFTLQFWVKSNKTGTYIVELTDENNSRHVAASYTVSASGAWEKKTLVFPADTTGAFNNDNALSLDMTFWLGVGSSRSSGTLATSWASKVTANSAVGQVNLADAINNYWQITGVQLEAGPVATPFEFEPFETTLRKCQRYFCKSTPITETNFTTLAANSNMNSGAWWCVSGGNGGGVRAPFPVEMRAVPSVDFTAWTSTNTNVSNGGGMTMHAPGLGDIGGVLEYKSQTGLSIYTTTTTSYRMFFFWRANAEL